MTTLFEIIPIIVILILLLFYLKNKMVKYQNVKRKPLMVRNYYIKRDTNPFNNNFVKILDIRSGYVKYVNPDGYNHTVSIDLFKTLYEFYSPQNPILYNTENIVFTIDNYNVYKIDDKWAIIPKSVINPDFQNYKQYKALSIALIEHDL